MSSVLKNKRFTMENDTADTNIGCLQLPSTSRFCLTGGIVEASASLPGTNDITGLWPAFWTMGNLGRASYGSTLEGMW